VKAVVPLFYGSTTGSTARVAELIQREWPGNEPIELVDISESGVSAMIETDSMIIGAPTWDFGELQEDWRDEWDIFCGIDFSGKRVALFGVGDQLGYAEWFQDAMGRIAEQIESRGGQLVVPWPNEDYRFDSSLALRNEGTHFVGLALDEDTQSWATEERVQTWLGDVAEVFANEPEDLK